MGQERVKQMNLTDEQVEAWKRAFELAGVDLDALGECLLKIAKALTIAYMELEKAMEQVANIARAGLIEAASELEEFEDLERELKKLNLHTARDRKETREKRRAVERAAASRFRQYRVRESAWSARKRTGPRRREWRGPWKES